MDKDDIAYRQQVVNTYKPDVEKLIRYLPWLDEKAGSNVQETFEGSGIKESSITFPVYDGMLMSFIKEASKSALMEKNYSYTYTRNHIKTHDDERRLIRAAELKDWDILRGILSKYVLGGRTKAVLWSEAVQENIFVMVLEKMRKIIEFWDKPLDVDAR